MWINDSARRLLPLAAAGLASCGGKQTQIEIKPPPPKMTTGTLAGPLCGDGKCACRDGAVDAGLPEDGRKRFEIRLMSAYDLWVKTPDAVLYKSPETSEACFYVDLTPGKHPLEIRASNPDGVSLAVAVHELGTRTKSWYDTFTFRCGHPGVCSFSELDGKQAEYGTVKRGLHDPCGSTKIRNVAWDHGKSPDQLHPSELVVQFALDIYKFAPWKPHGDTSCGEGGGPPPDEPTPDAPATPEP
jgi:hypothetical protein